MTAINVTITPSRAWLSQDRAFYNNGELPALDVLAKDHKIDPKLAATDTKLAIRADKQLISGIAGGGSYWLAWRGVLNAFGGDFDGLTHQAPDILRAIFSQQSSDQHELIVVLAGWSKKERRVVGYGYQYDSDFEPMRLQDGLTHAVPISPEAPNYDRLERLWYKADKGRKVAAFHKALFANQQWQCKRGLLRAGVLLSDDYDLASVDKDGARLEQTPVSKAA